MVLKHNSKNSNKDHWVCISKQVQQFLTQVYHQIIQVHQFWKFHRCFVVKSKTSKIVFLISFLFKFLKMIWYSWKYDREVEKFAALLSFCIILCVQARQGNMYQLLFHEKIPGKWCMAKKVVNLTTDNVTTWQTKAAFRLLYKSHKCDATTILIGPWQ